MLPFSRAQERILIVVAAFGLCVVNGVFLYYSLVDPSALRAALGNPIAVVFMTEAFILMFLCAWLIHRSGSRHPGWIVFLVLSFVGSMAFSVPAFLYIASRRARASVER